jgi:glycosyltransferase involved in cell wall biosynthesis
VSIIIPCFNGSATLGETLDSVQRQTFPAWEAIIVDDGSTDNSGEVIAGYSRRDCRFSGRSQENRGLGSARNTGLAQARGEFVLFLDADDLLRPEMLERMVKRLAGDPSIGVAHCGWICADPEGRDLRWTRRFPREGALFDSLAHVNPFPCHSVMLRRSLFEATGEFDTSIRHCHDWDLWVRVARAGAHFGAVPTALVVYRMQRVSLSRSPRTFFEVGAEILRRSHAPDSRVRHPAHGLENGCRCGCVRKALVGWLVHCLGFAVAQGNDVLASELVEAALGHERHDLAPARLRGIVSAMHFAAAIPWSDNDRLMTEVGATLLRFLVAEEAASKRPGFALASLAEVLSAHPSQRSMMLARVSAREMLAAVPRRVLRRVGLAR